MNYILLNELTKLEFRSGSIDIFKIYFRRYFRITPSIAVLLLVYFLYVHFKNEVPYSCFAELEKHCSKNWWAILMHVQNYVNICETVNNKFCHSETLYFFHIYNQCMMITWHATVDFQLTLVTPLLVIALYKWKWLRFTLLPCLIAVCQHFIYKQDLVFSELDRRLVM